MANNLWISIQSAMPGKPDHDIIGAGTCKVYAKEGETLKATENVTFTLDDPGRVVFFQQDVPPLTTIKIFDAKNALRFHLLTEEQLQIK
jgi:hypothetical protein